MNKQPGKRMTTPGRARTGRRAPARPASLASQRRQQNPLTLLTPRRARELYELYRKGLYADPMLAWESLEEVDETLATVVDRRQSALGEMEWVIATDAQAIGDSEELATLAERQQNYLSAHFRRVSNLTEAVKWLGLASFRKYAHLEVVQAGRDIRWLPIHQCYLTRPEAEGAWRYNAEATTHPLRAEELDTTSLIIREVARPIDLPCMFLICAKNAAVTQWDGFMDTFGIPSIFVQMPPGTNEELRLEFMGVARGLLSDGRGVLPSGAEIKTVETSAKDGGTFSSRADWCDKGIVRRATGGQLTVLTEAGSGTLAGNAQQETFRMLAAAEAADIASCINRQYTARILNERFPGQPHLAYWMLETDDEPGRKQKTDTLVQLAAAGWRANDETVSEIVGFDVVSAPQPGQEPADRKEGSQGMPEGQEQAALVTNRREAEPPAPPTNGVPEDIERLLAEALRPEALAADAAALARGIEDAITHSVGYQAMPDGQQQAATQSPDPGQNALRVENSCNQYAHEPGCPDADNQEEPEGGWPDEEEDPYADEEPAEPDPAPLLPVDAPPAAPKSRSRRAGEALLRWMSHLFLPARIARRRYEQEHGPIANSEEDTHSVENSCNQHAHEPGCTGANLKKQKGTRHSKGNPAGKPGKSNVPTMLPETATDGELERQLRKALDATDKHSGNQTVTRGRETYSLTQQRSDHRRKHQGEGTTNEAIAKTLTQGSFEKDGTDGTAYRKKTKVIKYTNPRTGAREIRTAYYEPDYRPRDRKKNPGQEPGPTDR